MLCALTKEATFLNVIEAIVASGPSPFSNALIEVFIDRLYDVFLFHLYYVTAFVLFFLYIITVKHFCSIRWVDEF